MPVDLLSLEAALCPPPTLAQQVGLAESCQEGAESSAAGLRLPFSARMSCGPSRKGQSALPLYALTGRGGHRLACVWARKRGDTVESRVYLLIFKNLLKKYVLGRGQPGSSLLPAALQANLFVGESGRRERCCRKPSYSSGARGVRAPSLAGLGMVKVPIQDLMETNQQHCL